MNNLYTFLAVTKYIRKGASPLHYKLQNIFKFAEVYSLHTKRQQKTLSQERKLYEMQIKVVSPYERIYNQRINFYNKIQQVRKNSSISEMRKKLSEYAQQKKNSDEEFKNIFSRFFQYLSLYYESLQQLVEGRREVLHDENFKFPDSETAKDKTERFEKMMTSLMGKVSPNKKGGQ